MLAAYAVRGGGVGGGCSNRGDWPFFPPSKSCLEPGQPCGATSDRFFCRRHRFSTTLKTGAKLQCTCSCADLSSISLAVSPESCMAAISHKISAASRPRAASCRKSSPCSAQATNLVLRGTTRKYGSLGRPMQKRSSSSVTRACWLAFCSGVQLPEPRFCNPEPC